MDNGPLVNEEVDEGAALARRFSDYAPLKAAFWLKESDEDQRYLYLASDAITHDNLDLAYGEAMQLAYDLKLKYLDPFRIKLIGGDDPRALAALTVSQRFRDRIPTRLGGTRFGGLTVDDAYIYPKNIAEPPVQSVHV